LNSQQPFANEPTPDFKAGEGLTMHMLLNLPEEKRLLISWLLRHNNSTLDQIVQYTQKDHQTVKSLLQDLINHNFIEAVPHAGGIHYQVKMVSMRRSRYIYNQS
jgi:predicted transcriptional regulator